MTLENTYEIPDQIVAREVGGETVILDLNRGMYCGLNDVGARCWALLATGVSAENAVQTMHDEYDVEPSVLEADIVNLIDELVSKSLVIKREPKVNADE